MPDLLVADVLRGVVLLGVVLLGVLDVMGGVLVVLLAAALVVPGAALALDDGAGPPREACVAQELPGSQAAALSRTRGAASNTAGNVRFMCDLSCFGWSPSRTVRKASTDNGKITSASRQSVCCATFGLPARRPSRNRPCRTPSCRPRSSRTGSPNTRPTWHRPPRRAGLGCGAASGDHGERGRRGRLGPEGVPVAEALRPQRRRSGVRAGLGPHLMALVIYLRRTDYQEEEFAHDEFVMPGSRAAQTPRKPPRSGGRASVRRSRSSPCREPEVATMLAVPVGCPRFSTHDRCRRVRIGAS
ncbi:hypothetical protein EDD35_8003 [Amycolatopsis thermoflava]|uniref:Uncharacterized protein n=1 Tax=Amycolatopsis thermoflava TaxID=84480 RepID=A0A3N2G7N9_9PSEU|nr:hypothetical protein EDD35_8003 [Amycolatopsis thermoflava]